MVRNNSLKPLNIGHTQYQPRKPKFTFGKMHNFGSTYIRDRIPMLYLDTAQNAE